MITNSTLQRRTPLRAKKPFWAASKRPEKKYNSFFKPRAGIRKVSKKRAKQYRAYYPIQRQFIRENPWCVICLVRGHEKPNPTTEVHHIRGRNGALLTDTRFFCASCRECSDWPHQNQKKARDAGILAPAHEYDVVPRD